MWLLWGDVPGIALLVISLIILAEHGYASPAYIFYFPAVLAISVAFPTIIATGLVGGVVIFYTFVGLLTVPFSGIDVQVLLIRLLMIAAVAACGNLYWRLEHKRHSAHSAVARSTASTERVSTRAAAEPVSNFGQPVSTPQS